MAAKLTFIAYQSRRIIRWGAVGIVIYTILHISVVAAYRAIVASLQRPEPPNPVYGLLPLPDFPPQDNNLVFTYKLETATLSLPQNFPDRAKIYINHQYTPNLLALNDAVTRVKKLGFEGEPLPINPPNYRWRNRDKNVGILEMNVFQGNFDIILDWYSNNSFLVTGRPSITNEQLFQAVQAAMNRAGVWVKEDWKGGKYSIIYYRFINGQLVKVPYQDQADFAQVNMRRNELDGKDFVFADPERPVVWGLVALKNRAVVELHYHYQGIDSTAFSEYPLAPISDVWQRFLKNQAYIASIGENVPGSEVIIRHFDLAYYQTSNLQKFTQPVYVIRGDKGFVAYVPAVDPRLYQSSQ